MQSAPLVYYFGHSSPGDNVKLYQHLVSLLAGRVDGRLERDADARASGVIINTAGWGDQAGYDVLLQCIQAFSVDVVLVMGHDKLYSKFSTDVGDHVTDVKLPKSGGVVERVRFYSCYSSHYLCYTVNVSSISFCLFFYQLSYLICT